MVTSLASSRPRTVRTARSVPALDQAVQLLVAGQAAPRARRPGVRRAQGQRLEVPRCSVGQHLACRPRAMRSPDSMASM